MKKFVMIAVAIVCAFLLNVIVVATGSVKTSYKVYSQNNPLPDSVMKLTGKSCVDCHGANGSKMAMSMLNLSEWDKYTPEKQASKSKAMCNEVTKGKMPPKKYLENNPDATLSANEIKVICDWATSLQIAKN
jgi:hypothetical protein